MCSHPDCKMRPVMEETEDDFSVMVGEAAHIVARNAARPRGGAGAGARMSRFRLDSYENLILLCRNHHADVDRSCPADFQMPFFSVVSGHPRQPARQFDAGFQRRPIRVGCAASCLRRLPIALSQTSQSRTSEARAARVHFITQSPELGARQRRR
jgi:hypothetical protein